MLDTARLRRQPTAMQQLQATPCPPGMVNLALKFRLAEAEALLKHERWVSGNLQDQVDCLKVRVGGLAWLSNCVQARCPRESHAGLAWRSDEGSLQPGDLESRSSACCCAASCGG